MKELTSDNATGLPVSRRALIQQLGGGLGAIGLLQALAPLAQASPPHAGHFVAKARRVIHLFMNGGPFGVDMFDPKPALLRYEGQRPKEVDLRTERRTAGLMPSPFVFRNRGKSGVPVSELLPLLGAHIDDICVIRSVFTDNPNHGPALLLMNNGTISPKRPSMGAWLSYGLGSENQDLPAYVVLCPGRPVRFSILWNSAFLPGEHQGTYINHSRIEPDKMIPFLRNEFMSQAEQREQLDLMTKLNRLHLEGRGRDTRLEGRIQAMETAFRMQVAASEAFDLSLEPESIRRVYGESHFAHGCLLARRLAERGVRFTQVYYGDGQPWDTHADHNSRTRKLCQDIDRPIAALLSDLKQRGLLEETLVIWGGEFGRTPTTDTTEGNGDGRDHNHYGFTMWMAGAGVRGGLTYGETDEFGFRGVKDRVHIHDLHATILHLLGIDHRRLTYRYAGRDFRLTDEFGNVLTKIIA